ncbi:MAG: GntR family transcriptional regulator [Roseibaca calidilacus]|uniref:GntR family transcriptional regulator n=1 Tax=Roseibaca calidilacus TaxID=1666912 RepID=A0A0P7W982_9RHOB|nr:GntR family transcriptional regulator [Roseibaca calidilacus]KPP90706.1 MAG: GntR family transcriptional regulator [Roseibaca calidilacus]CUX83422.1 transcriptional regulator, GntR family [Roseibaca calidilacus]
MTIYIAKPRAGDIADAIRKRICLNVQDGQAMLLEGVLAEEFGVSRTPVRQALQRLTYEGLIEVRTGVGSVVSPLEPAQRNMHFLVHHELLGLVARFPDEPIPSQIARRLDMIHAQGSSGRSADIESLYALFTEFNALLSQMIPDPIIADAHLISGWRIVRWLLADVQTGQGRLVTGAFDRIWTMCRDTGNGKAAFFREASQLILSKRA